MSELARFNPTGRFSGLADLYAQVRPSYPEAAIDCLVRRCALNSRSLAVDVGCGTGISSRQLAKRGLRVLALDPNDEMRSRAEATSITAQLVNPTYLPGRAEATGLTDSLADLVLAAQAFHWFEPQPALNEFHRILKPGGWLALMWNERDETDPFTRIYGDVIRTAPETAQVEAPRGRAGEALLHCPLFPNADRSIFPNEQSLTEDGLVARAFSASYAPRESQSKQEFETRLREIFRQWHRDGQVVIRYETSLYLGRKP